VTATTLPLSFSESITDFSKLRYGAIYATAYCYERAKLCVPFAVASSFRDMDVAYERCVKMTVIAMFIKSRLKNKLGRFSFGSVFFRSYKENELADRAKHQVNKN